MFGQRPGGGSGNTGGENGKKFPYTVETITIGGRLVLTADEENVKAILATQFADYGKGPQFRKEWKDFLGLSKFFFFFSFLPHLRSTKVHAHWLLCFLY